MLSVSSVSLPFSSLTVFVISDLPMLLSCLIDTLAFMPLSSFIWILKYSNIVAVFAASFSGVYSVSVRRLPSSSYELVISVGSGVLTLTVVVVVSSSSKLQPEKTSAIEIITEMQTRTEIAFFI